MAARRRLRNGEFTRGSELVSPSLLLGGRKGWREGTTEVEMGPKLVTPPFPPRPVAVGGVQACKPSLGEEVAVSVNSSFLKTLFPEKCLPPNFVSWPVLEPVLRKGSSGRLNETAMQRPLLTDLKCKFMEEDTNLVLDLVGLVE